MPISCGCVTDSCSEPNFFNADRLAGEDGAEVNLFVPQANATAVGDDNDLVVEGIVDVGQSPGRAGGGLIDLGRALHLDRELPNRRKEKIVRKAVPTMYLEGRWPICGGRFLNVVASEANDQTLSW